MLHNYSIYDECQSESAKDLAMSTSMSRMPSSLISTVGSDVDAFLPTHHLTDHKVLAEPLLDSYREGEVIRGALCFERDVVPVMTIKPMILTAVRDGSAPKSFADLQEGVSVAGAVCLVKE